MSQDQPHPSESSNSEPLESESLEALAAASVPPQPAIAHENLRPVTVNSRSNPAQRTLPENDEILPQTLLRLLGQAFVAAQPPLKQQGIKALRGTIHFLETTVERLEAEPAPKRKAPAPTTAPATLPPHLKPRTNRLTPTSTNALWQKFQTVWRQVWRSWRSILRQLRDRLPASINRSVSDRALTGVIAGILAIGLWATGALRDQPQPVAVSIPPVVTVAPTPTPVLTPTPTPTPIPPLVQSPEPEPVEISPAPLAPLPPAPPLKLTPEQTLIARIQDQVAAISNQYANGLVQSVQANFRSSRLSVNVSDGWYGLSPLQQDKLAGEMLQRTQALEFLKLEMLDGAGMLLARSPIVGTEMVILKRTNGLEQAA